MSLAPPTSRRGRPPNVNRAQIVEAVAKIPTDELSMASVAQALGVSVSGLYHHVKGREELLALAADSVAQDLRAPPDEGQPWWEWWYAYCQSMREGLKLHPDILRRVRGSHPGLVERLEAMMAVMDRSGFKTQEALTTIDTISNWLYGFVWREVEVLTEAEAGRPPDLELLRLLRQHPNHSLPNVERMVRRASIPNQDKEFSSQLWSILTGLAVQRGQTIPSSPPKL